MSPSECHPPRGMATIFNAIMKKKLGVYAEEVNTNWAGIVSASIET